MWGQFKSKRARPNSVPVPLQDAWLKRRSIFLSFPTIFVSLIRSHGLHFWVRLILGLSTKSFRETWKTRSGRYKHPRVRDPPPPAAEADPETSDGDAAMPAPDPIVNAEVVAGGDSDSDAEDDPFDYFYVTVRNTTRPGGGAAGDMTTVGRAREMVRPWCAVYGFAWEKMFKHTRHSPEDAHTMASEYVRRGAYYYKLFIDAGGENLVYTPDHVAAYPESEAWVRFQERVVGATARRAHEISNLAPMLGDFFD